MVEVYGVAYCRPTVCSGPASNAARTRSAHLFCLMPKREHWHTPESENDGLFFRKMIKKRPRASESAKSGLKLALFSEILMSIGELLV